MLSLRNVVCGYDERVVLRGVSLEVAAGEMVGVIGPNGCGKTTLFRVATGILPIISGEVCVGGRNIAAISPRDLAREAAFVSQDHELAFSFSVREVVLMGRSPHIRRFGWESRRDNEAARSAMAMCDILPLADRPMTELSGGERQRAFIAMALAQEPRLLFLDEPTSHLDINHQVGILDLARRLNRQNGLTVAMVSHDLNLASEYCDRLFMMREGQVLVSGEPAAVLTEAAILSAYQAKVRVETDFVTGRPRVVLLPGATLAREAV